MTSTHLDRNATPTLGFAALVHEMQGREVADEVHARDLELLSRPNDTPLFQPVLTANEIDTDAVALRDADQRVAFLYDMDA